LWANKAEETFTKQFAKATYGNVITNMKGKIAHNTYQRGRFGAIVRKTGKAINRNTTAQASVRAFFSVLTKNWKALTDTQRAGFRTGTAVFQKKDSLAQTITLTGHQLYIALNRNLQTISSALITAMPFKSTVPPVSTASVAAAAGAATMALTYTPVIPAADSWIVRATRALSAGKFSSEQDYKNIAVINAADVSPFDIKSAYETVFGTSWKTAGAKIFFTVKPVEKATGIPATTVRVSTIVAA
jgi:hypothetical protein